MVYDSRVSARQRGYNTRWEKARRTYLAAHPLCVMCQGQGRVSAATVVDHIIPHRGDQTLFWDSEKNWQALCKKHHDGEKQSEERLGYSLNVGQDGWPIDPQHPANSGKKPKVIGTSKSHPYWFRRSYVPLTIVCGPPGSGKSTYVRENAGPNDKVICFDQIATRLFGREGDERAHTQLDSKAVGDVLRARNEELGDLMRSAATSLWPAAWLIVGEPEAERRQWWQDRLQPKAIVVLKTPATVCKQRVAKDAERGDVRFRSVNESIDGWWSRYQPRDGDVDL